MSGRGFADVHCHQFANLGFGGGVFWGVPYGDISTAVPWCSPEHGPAGVLDIAGWVVKTQYRGFLNAGIGHLVSVTHQSVHVDWLERAWRGGLRLMVMLAVNNEWMCEVLQPPPPPGYVPPPSPCKDMDAVDAQLAAARQLETTVDQASGGPGSGWYRIVTSPAEASATIDAGKLAVVLGIEVDHLFGSYLNAGLFRSGRRQCSPEVL